ncbi:MAG: hypothetical protein AB7F89_13325 [Pirellulaceae bacterium]
MNGISLLFAIAALGVDGKVELVGGVPTWVIRVEAAALPELTQGRGEVVTEVTPKDRGVRRFRIVVTPEKLYQPPVNDPPGRSDSSVEYEAVQLSNQEVEMWVQVAPDRTRTWESGKAIEGTIPQEVREVHRFRVFVDVNALPSQQRSAPAQPPAYTNPPPGSPNYSLTAAETRSTAEASRPGPPALRPGLPSASNANTATPPLLNNSSLGNLGTNSSSIGSGGLGSRIGASLRNPPDQSTAPPLVHVGSAPTLPGYAPDLGAAANNPGLNNAYGQAAGVPDRNGGQYSGAPPGANYGPPGYGPGNNYPANNYGANNYAPNNYPPNSYAAGSPVWQNAYAQTNPAGQGGLGYPGQMPPMPNQQVVTARPDSQVAPTAATLPFPTMQVTTTAAGTAAPAPAAVTAATVSAPPAAPTADPRSNEVPKSSTPLILTTLALFTSLGVNTYLGWLAYSFFWRYRDAVNDSVRARSYNAPGRQAA